MTVAVSIDVARPAPTIPTTASVLFVYAGTTRRVEWRYVTTTTTTQTATLYRREDHYSRQTYGEDGTAIGPTTMVKVHRESVPGIAGADRPDDAPIARHVADYVASVLAGIIHADATDITPCPNAGPR